MAKYVIRRLRTGMYEPELRMIDGNGATMRVRFDPVTRQELKAVGRAMAEHVAAVRAERKKAWQNLALFDKSNKQKTNGEEE